MNCNELNDKINAWSTEDEEMLINKLKDYCDQYKNYCQSLDNELKIIEKNIDITNIDLLNGINLLKKISLTKYAVFKIDTNEKNTKSNNQTSNSNTEEVNLILSKEDKQKKQMMKYKTSINLSIDNLSLKKRKQMKLPFIIGTKDFFNCETLGVLDENNIALNDDLNKNKAKENDCEVNKKESSVKMNHNHQQNQIDGLKIKSFNLFNDNNMNEDEEDIMDEVLIKQYEIPQSNQRQLKNSKDKTNISIEQFVTTGIFDLDDEGVELDKGSLFKPKQKQENSLMQLIENNKNELEEENYYNKEDQLQINAIKDDQKHKTKETPLESAKIKLLKMFDEEDEEENNNDNDNNTEKIKKKTDEMTKKLNQITGERQKANNNPSNKLINKMTSHQIFQKKDETKKEMKKTLFLIEDEDIDTDKFKIKEKSDISSQSEVHSIKLNDTNSKIDRLNLIFKDEANDNINTDALITQFDFIRKDNQQNEEKKNLNKEEIKHLPQFTQASFKEAKAFLNERISSFHQFQTKNDISQSSALDKDTQMQCNLNINNNNFSIIKKKKPHKPSFAYLNPKPLGSIVIKKTN